MARRDEFEISRSRTLRSRRAFAARRLTSSSFDSGAIVVELALMGEVRGDRGPIEGEGVAGSVGWASVVSEGIWMLVGGWALGFIGG